MPIAGVRDARARRASPLAAQRDADRALERELERVREQVEDDLLPHLAIDVDRLRQRRALDHRSCSPARSIADRNALARSAVSAARSVGSKRRATRPASMREKSSSVFTSLSSRSSLRWTVSSSSPRSVCSGDRERVLRRTEHQRQRRAELVADVAEERRLGAIELRQRLGARLLLFERLGGRDRGADLGRDQREKVPIRIVEQQPLTGAGNQNAQRMVDPLSGDRHSTIRPGVEARSGSTRPGAAVPPANTSGRPDRRTAVNWSCPGRLSEAGPSLAGRRPRRGGKHRSLTVLGEQIYARERQIGDLVASTRPAISHASAAVLASRVSAASACVVFRRRSPTTRAVVSVTVTSTPPTRPLSSRIGLYRKNEVALLREPVPIQRQHEIDDVRRPALHDAAGTSAR